MKKYYLALLPAALLSTGLLSIALLSTAAIGLLPATTLAQEASGDSLGDLTLEMEQVVIDLSGMTTGEPVQETQKQIVTKLDKLIEELEKESESMRGGSSGPNPMRPMNDSVIKGGPGGMGDLHAARKTGKQWAELPPHERDRIVQSMTEGFPAHYQKILERYYKRLAEENAPGAATEEDRQPSDRQPAEAGKAPEAKKKQVAKDPPPSKKTPKPAKKS